MSWSRTFSKLLQTDILTGSDPGVSMLRLSARQGFMERMEDAGIERQRFSVLRKWDS